MVWGDMQRALLVRILRMALAAGFTFAVLLTGLVVWRSSRALRSATDQVREERGVRFVVRPFPALANTGFEAVSSPTVFVRAARFRDHLFVAGSSGLVEYEANGSLLHQYSVGSELPGSPLVDVAPAVLADSHESKLIIATAADGILAFNGHDFRQIFPSSPNARSITAILPASSGHLLFGTRKHGVLVYDGTQITVLHAALNDLYVTALAGTESDLWVGTLNRGVLHFHGGEVEEFSEAQGLPDPQVESVAILGDATYIGTAAGVAVFSRGQFSRVLAPGVLATSVLATSSQLYIGSEDQGIITIPLQGRRPGAHLAAESQMAESQIGEVRQLFVSDDAILAVARNGLYRLNAHAFGWQRVLDAGSGILTDRNISALATDATGRLWVGYFDRGLDLLSSENVRASHVEDEHVFCVNRIFPDSRAEVVDVATANGLVRFDDAGREQQVLTRSDGLIADHVTDVVAYGDGLALATPAGLTFLDQRGARSMYAFHGLVNNHIYALGVSGDELLAGTLGGLSLLNKSEIAANYSTATSNLKHNWITAVVRVGDEWMVGTYGAGVLSLDRSGEFHTFELGSDSFEVNPNAMLVTANYVLAGSLGQGLYVYDRQSGRWSVIRDGLPSANVTALAEANGTVYVGTDNGLVRISEQKLHP